MLNWAWNMEKRTHNNVYKKTGEILVASRFVDRFNFIVS
jgi:hypothetical protein